MTSGHTDSYIDLKAYERKPGEKIQCMGYPSEITKSYWIDIDISAVQLIDNSLIWHKANCMQVDIVVQTRPPIYVYIVW